MPKIRSATEIASKWGRVTPQRTPDYEAGVKAPKKDWATEAKAAEGTYKTAVTTAAAEGRFGKGVAAAGTTKWQTKAVQKGTQRWGPGVQIAQGDYESGFAPFRDVIERTDIGPRFAKGDPRNIERVTKIAKALYEKRVKG